MGTLRQASTTNSAAAARDFLTFVRAAPSPFHAVAEARRRLEAAGFVAISERDAWSVARNGRYFFTRNQSSIVAFVVGGAYKSGNGFSIIGAHTDSPCLKVKPLSKKETAGYLKVGVETYGGGLWNTWFDRDLGIAGRVLIKSATNDGPIQHRLVKIDEPILRIPTLAIHLDRTVGTEGFKFNNETHLTPMLGLAAKSLNGSADDKPLKHHAALLNKIATQLNVNADDIGDFELCLYDTHPSTIGGIADEFIFSARLDNLMSSYCAIEAIIKSVKETGSESDSLVRVVSLFDNEEVGSQTAFGADSDLLEVTLRRLAGAVVDGQEPGRTAFEQSLTRSFLISADMAHAVHCNYSEKHEDNHRPSMNKGIVIKQNANQRYATTAVTTTILREVAKKRNVNLQEFVVRNDSPCGSTIGPMLSAKLGLRTIDVGNPQLSMHSIRETCGVEDVGSAIDLFQSFFEDFAAIDRRISVDL
ncbi:aspartyl aminopeptidase [Obelidium mucronatum]|nr:aspartyl aminopeptidase [Obelidium mucronatum]